MTAIQIDYRKGSKLLAPALLVLALRYIYLQKAVNGTQKWFYTVTDTRFKELKQKKVAMVDPPGIANV